MRVAMLTMAAVLIGSPAVAECSKGSGDVMFIAEWTTGPTQPSGAFDAIFQITSRAAKPTRMVEATIWFKDLLGRNLNGWHLDADFKIEPGATEQFALTLGTLSFDGRPLRRDDLTATLCTKAILFADGTKQEF